MPPHYGHRERWWMWLAGVSEGVDEDDGGGEACVVGVNRVAEGFEEEEGGKGEAGDSAMCRLWWGVRKCASAMQIEWAV